MAETINTIAKTSEEGLKLREYMSVQSPGSFITYLQIQDESGVLMDSRGKNLVRSALTSQKIEYTCLRGKGIELAGVETAVGIMNQKFVRVSNTIKKAAKTQKNIQEKFYDDLSEQDKRKVLLAGTVFAMMHAMAKDNSKSLVKNTISNTETYSIELPKIKN